MIQPELIQFLFDFEGHGFPLDALLKYRIDPLYFAELPEDEKLNVLEQERKKYNEAFSKLEEQKKLGDLNKQREIKVFFNFIFKLIYLFYIIFFNMKGSVNVAKRI